MKSKIAITLDEEIVKQLDYLIMQQSYKNRSQAIEEAVSEKLDRLKRKTAGAGMCETGPGRGTGTG